MVATQRTLGVIARYVVDMGADIELFEIASRVPPWEGLRPLTREELRRLHVHNAEHLELAFSDPLAGARPAPGSSPPAQAALGWMLVEKQDLHALVRTHPLTIDGEQIGSFEISFRCADNPGVYVAQYVEKRRSTRSPDDRLNAVGISAERERAMLTIQSSRTEQPGAEIISVARGVVSAKFMNALGSAGNSPLVVATATVSKARTTILVGRAGLPENLSKMTTACAR
jgi:hypothetical protein